IGGKSVSRISFALEGSRGADAPEWCQGGQDASHLPPPADRVRQRRAEGCARWLARFRVRLLAKLDSQGRPDRGGDSNIQTDGATKDAGAPCSAAACDCFIHGRPVQGHSVAATKREPVGQRRAERHQRLCGRTIYASAGQATVTGKQAHAKTARRTDNRNVQAKAVDSSSR